MAFKLSYILKNIKYKDIKKKEDSMNKYVAVVNSICDGCVNGATCKGRVCKRKQTLLALAKKYELLSSAYDRVCDDYGKYTNTGKEAVKDKYYME